METHYKKFKKERKSKKKKKAHAIFHMKLVGRVVDPPQITNVSESKILD